MIDKSRLPDHYYALDCREGLIAPDFDLEQVDEVFLRKSREFLHEHVRKNPGRPFFLFPLLPGGASAVVSRPGIPGQTKAGPHGDFIFQFDAVVGRLLDTLDGTGRGAPNTGDRDQRQRPRTAHRAGHAGELRARRRPPMARRETRQLGRRPPRPADRALAGRREIRAARSAQTVSLTDLMATAAEITGHVLPPGRAEDSVSLLPVLSGRQPECRSHCAATPCRSRSAGFPSVPARGNTSITRAPAATTTRNDGHWGAKSFALPEHAAPDAPGQLYHLERDPGERDNLYFKHPQIVESLKQELFIGRRPRASRGWNMPTKRSGRVARKRWGSCVTLRRPRRWRSVWTIPRLPCAARPRWRWAGAADARPCSRCAPHWTTPNWTVRQAAWVALTNLTGMEFPFDALAQRDVRQRADRRMATMGRVDASGRESRPTC
jgi:hypothetical protein